MGLTGGYYWNDVPNWGDRIAPFLFEHFGLCEGWCPIEQAQWIGLGSIIEKLPEDWPGFVLGSGKRLDTRTTLPDANIWGVRGPETAKLISPRRNYDFSMGDPGLIFPAVIFPDSGFDFPDSGFDHAKVYDIAILPHWTDVALAHDKRFYGNWETEVLSPFDDPVRVVIGIAEAAKLVTSSLHGLIIADALGIPRRFEPSWGFLNNPHEGGDFKFRDYHASINMPFRVGELQTANSNQIEKMKKDILDMYETFRQIYRVN